MTILKNKVLYNKKSNNRYDEVRNTDCKYPVFDKYN